MAITARDELLKTMRASVPLLRALVSDRSLEDLRRQPEPGEWSAAEVLCHLADTEERALGRVRRILREDDPMLPGYDQAQLAVERGYRELDAFAELDRYEELRTEHLALLGSLDDPAWLRTGRHSEHGAVTLELLLVHVAAEDVDHLAQIARALLPVGRFTR
jgi:uncharacterized damage-inducible protein DinB